MSELLYKTSLSLWLKGETTALTYGVGTGWGDSSGQSNAFITGTLTPTLPTDGSNPYALFNGSTDFLTGPAPSTYMLNAQTTVFVVFYANTASATNAAAVNDNVILGGQSSSNPCIAVATVAGTPKLIADTVDSGGRKTVSTTCSLGAWHIGIWGWDGSTVWLYLDDPLVVANSTAAGASTTTTGTGQIAKNAAGSQFFDGRIGEILSYKAWLSDANRATVYNYLRARWATTGDSLEMMRDVASRRVWTRSQPRLHFTAKKFTPATPLPTTIGSATTQETFISHPRGLTTTTSGPGWGEQYDWQPRPGRVESVLYDFDNLVAELRCADLHTFRHSLWESGKATLKGAQRDGMSIGGVGPVRIFYNGVNSQYVDAADLTSVHAATADSEETNTRGLSIVSIQNYLDHSSFIAGTSGLNTAGTSVGGGSITLDTSTLIFDTSITPNSLKLTNTGTSAGDLYVGWTGVAATTPKGAKMYFLGILHDGTGPPSIQLQRYDGKWLQSDGVTYSSSGAAWYSVPAIGSYSITKLSVIPLGSMLATTTAAAVSILRYGIPSGTAASTARMYHASVTIGSCPLIAGQLYATSSNNILENSPSYVDQNTLIDVVNQVTGSMGPGGPADSQTIAFKFIATSTALGFDNTKGAIDFLAGSSFSVGNEAGWRFIIDSAPNLTWGPITGSTATEYAYAPYSSSIGTEHRVVLRRISTHADNGATAYTMSIFLDGTSGTNGIEATHPADAQFVRFFSGAFESAVTSFETSPYAWTDLECKAWGA